MDRNDEELILYTFLREEIRREDDITNQRLTSACAFQGFLIASMTFLLNGAWPPESKADLFNGLTHFRIAVLGGLGIMGLLVAITSTLGVRASRRSIASVIDKWERASVNLDSRLPQAYGEKGRFGLGHSFATLTAFWFVFMWIMYLIAFVRIIFWGKIVPWIDLQGCIS